MPEMLLRSIKFLLTILVELIPLFLIVTFLSGLALEYISPEKLRRGLSGRKGLVGQTAAMGLGWVTPFCSCSTIPVLASMVKAGIPIGIMTTFLYASPYPVEIAIPILAPLFGVPTAAAFMIAGGAIALTMGVVVERLGWQRQIKAAVLETSAGGMIEASINLGGDGGLVLALDDSFKGKAIPATCST